MLPAAWVSPSRPQAKPWPDYNATALSAQNPIAPFFLPAKAKTLQMKADRDSEGMEHHVSEETLKVFKKIIRENNK